MYTPLYIKKNYSLLSSLIDIHELIKYVREKNIKSLAITDDNLCGMMEFYKECKKNDIKPIIGLEIKLENDCLYLYAKDYIGYQSLIKLSTIQSERIITIDIANNSLLLFSFDSKTLFITLFSLSSIPLIVNSPLELFIVVL